MRIQIRRQAIPTIESPIVIQVNNGNDVFFHALKDRLWVGVTDVLLKGFTEFFAMKRGYLEKPKSGARIVAVFKPKSLN